MFAGELSAGILSFIEKYCWVYSDFEVISTLYIRRTLRMEGCPVMKSVERKGKKRKEISNIYLLLSSTGTIGPISHRVAAGSAAVEQCQDLPVDRYLIRLPVPKHASFNICFKI